MKDFTYDQLYLTVNEGFDAPRCGDCLFFSFEDNVWGWCKGSPPIEQTIKYSWWRKSKKINTYPQVLWDLSACRIFKSLKEKIAEDEENQKC